MSPRAAWLLERYGFLSVFDYVDGKSDWMAFGLPVEGEEGPFAGDALVDVTTCGPDEPAAEVSRRLVETSTDRAVVVNDDGIVLGLAEQQVLTDAGPGPRVAAVMTLSPTTVRPSVPLSELGGDEPVLITDSDGRLLGTAPGRGSADVDHGDHEADDPELQRLQGAFLDVVSAVEEHFEGRDPTEAEVRSFLRDRLVAEGSSPEEAERFLEEMDGKSS